MTNHIIAWAALSAFAIFAAYKTDAAAIRHDERSGVRWLGVTIVSIVGVVATVLL